ncbi:MAG: hypothetical protein WEA35_04800 [Candidatus Nanopelagicales bacterium]
MTTGFYDISYLTSRGRVRKGLQQGSRTFYRRDGSPLRSGSFAAGDPVGEWTTYTRDGAPRGDLGALGLRYASNMAPGGAPRPSARHTDVS